MRDPLSHHQFTENPQNEKGAVRMHIAFERVRRKTAPTYFKGTYCATREVTVLLAQ